MQVYTDAANRSLLLPDVMSHPENTSPHETAEPESAACYCNLAEQKNFNCANIFVIKIILGQYYVS